MRKVKFPIHEHPLLPISRFSRDKCEGCGDDYIYGGYRCNESQCHYVIHRECAVPSPEINHSLHPDHPLKLLQSDEESICSQCSEPFQTGYICSICDFPMDLRCAKETAHILQNSNLHEHPLYLTWSSLLYSYNRIPYDSPTSTNDKFYECRSCPSENLFSVECVFPGAIHTSHPQHPLKLLTVKAAVDYTVEVAPDYADKKCLLCAEAFDQDKYKLYHCDVCNFSICPGCMKYPPPIRVESLTTHEHELHLVSKRIDFTCDVCGTLGHQSPYFCIQCNFMIHRQCIDLPRVININRHDHRISYTRRLGHGEEWKCKICRKKVDGFYGGYTCVKCPTFAVHSLCATRKDIWDMIELEGMPEEEEEIPPFEVIDANTIKHFSHDHKLLRINKDDHDHIKPETIVCEACCLQVLSEPFYTCKPCHFTLHDKCANHPRKKRHVCSNRPFKLVTDSRHKVDWCSLCFQYFNGFRYKDGGYVILDVRCAAISDTLKHESHKHPLYYEETSKYNRKICSHCGDREISTYRCDECDHYILDGKCAHLPKKIMRNRYDDHLLSLYFGDMNVKGDYWCEACETKVDAEEWFYTCNDCGTILHISCAVGDFSYIMPEAQIYKDQKVVSNTSICRPLCYECKSRCKLASIFQTSKAGGNIYYYCSSRCRDPNPFF